MKYSDITVKYPIGNGSTAMCYLLDDGRVFKEFRPCLSVREMANFKMLLNIQNNSFRFPQELVYDDKNFYGYVTGYASGKTIDESIKDANLEKLSIHTISFENDIKRLSEQGIKIRDLNGSNLMYDGNKLIGIDTDMYTKEDDPVDLLTQENVFYYKFLLNNVFCMNLNRLKNIDFILEKSTEYTALKNVTSGEMIYNILELLKKQYGSEIKSISDIKTNLR